MATRFEIYKQALLDLERASAELDQVHASLKDIGLHNTVFGRRADLNNIQDLVADTDLLLKELREADCPECDHAIANHGRQDGCEHEMLVDVDGYSGGGISEQPCGCRWGLEEPTNLATPAVHR
jgi:hypothetical protein